MRSLVVGYGSMGRRRIRLLSELMPDVEVICVDSNTDRQKQAKDAGFVVYGNLEETVNENLDVAFVCTSPGRHANII